MRFQDRAHVETVGRFGLQVERDDAGLRAKQLNAFWLYVDEEDEGYTKHAVGDGYWESWITLWMDRNVPDGSFAIDIGANHGYYTFFLASKGCKVIAFEPQPSLVELLHKSQQVNEGEVYVHGEALSNRVGTTQMMVPINHGMNATISNQFTFAPRGFRNVEVRTDTLNHRFGKAGVDFIKVDAEGAEDLIWAGSERFREDNPNCLWLMEWRWDRYRDPAGFGQDILDNYKVSHVNVAGDEEPIESVSHLATREHEDWMLVLRSE